MIKYSVIIPVYKAEKTIERCLNSLLLQGREDIEIIAVDDGSPDNCGMILDDYQNEYSCVRVIHQENGGVSSARNAGINAAIGDYILFVDSDDYVSGNYFEQLDGFSNEDLCVFSIGILGTDDTDADRLNHFDSNSGFGNQLVSLITTRRILSPINKRFKKSIIEKNRIQFVSDFAIAEDFDFCMNYSVHCKSAAVCLEVLYQVDVSDQNSLSRKYRPYLTEQLKAVFLHIEELITASSMQPEDKQKILSAVDYLYARNVVACFAEESKNGSASYFRMRKQYKEISSSFSNIIGESERYINRIHKIARFMIRKKLTFAIYCIAYLIKR
ncbi:MAG: glycosyltransferase [Lachnospiraceae bacterium]|nr:glycosyltransferase [Lachnospiraceae bacterium]